MRVTALLLVFCACPRTQLVGSLICGTSADCAPPASVCSADGRCIPGCTLVTCAAGTMCNPASGECFGGPAQRSCMADGDCDPPDFICRAATHTCVAGCTLSDTCIDGLRCNPVTGHCCSGSDCPARPDAGQGCNSDSECVGAPATICSGGACVPGCTSTGCVTPLSCDPSSGHCMVARCARDLDCDSGSYCTQSSRCAVLAFGGQIDCAGGTAVTYTCAMKTTAAQMTACTGPAGPVGCPYCLDDSCYHPGLCASDSDCHGGNSCVDGLCRVDEPPCPSVVPIADVVNGHFAAGKEVCVRGKVSQVRAGYDGMNEVKLDTSPFLYVDVSPLYQTAGVSLPALGQTMTVHGTVRWDDAHDDYELLPVDFFGP